MTREDGVFTLKLDEGASLAMLVSFAQDMFPQRRALKTLAFGRPMTASWLFRCAVAEQVGAN